MLNRRGLWDAIDEARPDRAAPRSVLLCDVDHVTASNDRFDHAVGDQTLRYVGQALSECAGPERLVARLGGDEFVVMCWDGATHLSQQLRAAVAHPCQGSTAAPVFVTTGHAERTRQDDSVETPVERADAAMYERRRQRPRAEDNR